MGARSFILTLLLVAAVGAGAGYAAARLLPAPEEQEAPETQSPAAPDAGAQGSEADVTVDELIAAMPEEVRQEMENDPELAAQVRAQLQAAIESGQLPQGLAPGTGGDTLALGGAAARNATPLTGAVASFDGATLRLDTGEGLVDVTVSPDTTLIITRQASGAANALAVDADVTVIAQGDETGGQTAAAVLVGDAGSAGRGFGTDGAFGGAAATTAPTTPASTTPASTTIAGAVVSYAEGILSVQTEDGPQSVNVPPETIVRITTTASEAAGEFAEGAGLTVLVQRAADGSFEAVTVIVGDASSLGGRGLLRGQGGAQGGGQGDGGQGTGSGQQAP